MPITYPDLPDGFDLTMVEHDLAIQDFREKNKARASKKPKPFKHETKIKPSKEPRYKPVQKRINTYFSHKAGTVVRSHRRHYWVKMTPEEKAAEDSKDFIALDDGEDTVMFAKSMHIMFQQEAATGKDLEKEFLEKHS